jgi:hypothetical protein
MRIALILVTLAGCAGDNLAPAASQRELGNCFIGGCSMETCTPDQPAVSPCIFVPSFACYRDATCEPQPDAACGWTPSPALTACLAQFPPR